MFRFLPKPFPGTIIGAQVQFAFVNDGRQTFSLPTLFIKNPRTLTTRSLLRPRLASRSVRLSSRFPSFAGVVSVSRSLGVDEGFVTGEKGRTAVGGTPGMARLYSNSKSGPLAIVPRAARVNGQLTRYGFGLRWL